MNLSLSQKAMTTNLWYRVTKRHKRLKLLNNISMMLHRAFRSSVGCGLDWPLAYVKSSGFQLGRRHESMVLLRSKDLLIDFRSARPGRYVSQLLALADGPQHGREHRKARWLVARTVGSHMLE